MKVLEELWKELDDCMDKAMPIVGRINSLKKAQVGDSADDPAMKLAIAELELQKYREAGFAPGVAVAIQKLLPGQFEDYKQVVLFAQKRYKERQENPQIKLPEKYLPLDAEGKAPTTTEDPVLGVTTKNETTSAPAPATADAPAETSAKTTPEPTKPKRGRGRPRKNPAPDPGPSLDDPEPPKPKVERERFVPTKSVEEALAAAEEKVRNKKRPDTTEEDQRLMHISDLPPEPVDDDPPVNGERSPEEIAALLAALEERV